MIRALYAAALLAVPLTAQADQLSRAWTPTAARDAAALRAAISLRAHLEAGGSLRDWSDDGGDVAVVEQRGSGHAAGLAQTGGGNAGAILQWGEGAEGALAQEGGEAGVTLQYGLGDRAARAWRRLGR